MLKVIVLVTLCISLSLAQSIENNSTYIDETHSVVSHKVLEWADTLDDTLSTWVSNDNNISVIANKQEKKEPQKLTVDAFFQSNKYFGETENTFIRLRTDSRFQTKESNTFNVRVSAQIPFKKSKQSFKFFVDDLNVDSAKNILQEDKDDENTFPELGMHYFAPEKYGVVSRYSLGFQGISPFVRARYSMPLKTGQWDIEPVQILKYSSNDSFEEETNIYFDKAFEELSLLRIQLHRKTQDEVKGMDYALAVEYFFSPIEKAAVRLSQGFFGNTKYPYVVDNSIEPPLTKSFGGINNYVTSISWRQNIWRDWFYYEVSPSVNFHKDYDYEANYSVRIFFDFHFGEYK